MIFVLMRVSHKLATAPILVSKTSKWRIYAEVNIATGMIVTNKIWSSVNLQYLAEETIV